LQRQLQSLNTSFKLILDAERMKRCEILLHQNESLTAIAEQLGYSDQSALARAHKNLTGQTLLMRKRELQLANKNIEK
jgi:AraC-like DNA-binding protein